MASLPRRDPIVVDVPFYHKPYHIDPRPVKVQHILDEPLKSRRDFTLAKFESWIRAVDYNTFEGQEALRTRVMRARIEIFNSEELMRQKYWKFKNFGAGDTPFYKRIPLWHAFARRGNLNFFNRIATQQFLANTLFPWITSIEAACVQYQLKRTLYGTGGIGVADVKPAYFDVWMHPGNRKALRHFDNEMHGRKRRHGAFFGSIPLLVYAISKLRRPFHRFNFPFFKIAVLSSLIVGTIIPLLTSFPTKQRDLDRALRHFLGSTGNFAAAKLRLALQDYYYIANKQHPLSFPTLPHDKWDALVLTEHDRDVAAGNFTDRNPWIIKEREIYEKMIFFGQGAEVLEEQRKLQEIGKNVPSLYGVGYYAPFLPKKLWDSPEEKYTYNVEYYTAALQFIKEGLYSYFGYGFYWELFQKPTSEMNSRKWASRIAGISYYFSGKSIAQKSDSV